MWYPASPRRTRHTPCTPRTNLLIFFHEGRAMTGRALTERPNKKTKSARPTRVYRLPIRTRSRRPSARRDWLGDLRPNIELERDWTDGQPGESCGGLPLFQHTILVERRFKTLFPCRGFSPSRHRGRPAVESAPGVARTRPMAPRDRGSIRGRGGSCDPLLCPTLAGRTFGLRVNKPLI
jgi:hypothetical protein